MIFNDANTIYKAVKLAVKGSDKSRYNTQLFQVNTLLYTALLQRDLLTGKYKPSAGNNFTIRERGKTRNITSLPMVDKTVNHIICDEVLTPSLDKFLVYDNSASRKNKGVSFHRRRFKQHLRDFYRENGSNEGYILLGDFSSYYANLRHV